MWIFCLLSFQVCFLPGTLALGATKGITKKKAIEQNLLNAEDMENLNLAEDLAKTCFEMYAVTSTGLAPEIAYFHTEVSYFLGINTYCSCFPTCLGLFYTADDLNFSAHFNSGCL